MDSVRARRSKNVPEKLRVVSEGDKKDAAKARLDALENDDAVPNEDPAAGSDEDFELEDSEEEGGRHHCPFLTQVFWAPWKYSLPWHMFAKREI